MITIHLNHTDFGLSLAKTRNDHTMFPVIGEIDEEKRYSYNDELPSKNQFDDESNEDVNEIMPKLSH